MGSTFRLRVMSTALAALLLLSAAAAPQTLLFELTGASDRDLFGVVLDAADLNGDGRDDLVVGAPWDDTAGTNAGRVAVHSGVDGSLIRQWFGAAAGDAFGFALDVVGDVDGDGVPDVLVGAPGVEQPGVLSSGLAELRSGRNGLVLRTHVPADYEDQFGSRLGATGDLDGDGVGDYAVGLLWKWNEFGLPEPPLNGATSFFSGADGSPLPAAPITGGRDLEPLGDTTGDGVPEFVLTRDSFAFDDTRVQVLSGANAALLDDELAGMGSARGGPVADLDDDGLPDYALVWGAYQQDETLAVRSAVNGTLLSRVRDAAEVAEDGATTSLDGRADLNADGVPDLLVGVPGSDTQVDSGGRVSVLSGVDLSTLLELDGALPLGEFGWEVVALGDVDGDGCADWAASEPARSAHPMVPGKVRVYSGGALGFADQGGALAGAQGEPQLAGSGFLKPGTSVELALSSGAPSAPAVVVLGFAELSAPFKGGVLGPTPDKLLFGASTDATGAFTLTSTWPELPPATTIWTQVWIQDAAGPAGWAASNTLTATNAP